MCIRPYRPKHHQPNPKHNRLKDFLKDALFATALAKTGTRHLSHSQDLLAYALILLPPLAVAVIAPDIFFSALDNAGAFGIACLFGGSAVVYGPGRRHTGLLAYTLFSNLTKNEQASTPRPWPTSPGAATPTMPWMITSRWCVNYSFSLILSMMF